MGNMFAMKICQNTYEEIIMLESLISLVHETCLNLELNAEYYEDIEDSVLKINEERNRYLNILSMAQEKLKNIEKLNTKLEEEIIS